MRGSKGCANASSSGRAVPPKARPVVSPSERAAYLRWMDGRCFRCLSRKHFAKDCEEPLKCWRCYKDFHLASQCPGPSSKLSSTVPSHGPRLGVGDRRDAPASHASRQRSYAEALLAPPLGDRLARSVDGCVFPLAPVEQDLLAAMLSARPVGIDPWHNYPMIDEAMAPSPQVLPAIISPMYCFAWGDDMWLSHGASSVGSEESVDPMCL